MGGGAYDVYRVCEAMARSTSASPPASSPPSSAATRSSSAAPTSRSSAGWAAIADEGLARRLRRHRAGRPAATWPRSRRTADAGDRGRQASPATGSTARKQWITNGGVADLYTILAQRARRARRWFVVERGAPGLHAGQARGQARHPRSRNTAPLILDDVVVAGRRARRRRRGPGARAGAARSSATPALMVAAFGLGGGWAALDRAIAYSQERIQGGAPLSREAGLHAQAASCRTSCRLEAARAYIEETAERLDARRATDAQDRGRHRQVPRHRGRQRGGRRGHPGARRLRLHARVHGREDQARRAHHHDLRGHLRDHGDDHRPRPLAAAPEDARAATTTTGPARLEALEAASPGLRRRHSPPSRSTPLAEVLERCRDRAPHAPPARPLSRGGGWWPWRKRHGPFEAGRARREG